MRMNRELSMEDKPVGEVNSRPKGVSVIIPAFNEAMGIDAVLKSLVTVLSSWREPSEVIVVDDGSSDETAKIAKTSEGVKVIRHNANRGYGAALKSGIRKSIYPMICILDADGTYPVERISDLLNEAANSRFDMVVGWRRGSGAAVPILRRPPKWFIRRLARVVVGYRIPDLNSGLRVFNRSTVLRFFNLLPDGFSFTTTLTLCMLTNGFLVGYVPIEYHLRIGKSKIRPIQDTLNFIQLVLRIALYFKPMRIFIPLSALLMLLAIAWGGFSAIVLGKLADVSTSVLVLAAVQAGVVGLLADLINKRFPTYFKSSDGE